MVFATATASASAGYADATTWTLVGTGEPGDSGDGGHAREAAINRPRAVSALPDGGFVWAEPYAHRVRIVDPNGVVSTLAGTGEAGFAGDGGKATAAKLNFVHTAVPDGRRRFSARGHVEQPDPENIRSGIITTVAGTGVNGFSR